MSTQEPTSSLNDLVRRIAAADEAAISELWDRVAPRLRSLARRLVLDHHQADEVLSDVFVQIWRDAGQFDPARSSAEAWMLMITRSRSLDRLRSKAVRAAEREVARSHDDALMDLPSPGPARTRPYDLGGEVRDALARLPDLLRRPIEIAFFGQLAYQEVARLLGVPEGTLKSRIRTGLRLLREQLAPVLMEQPS
jgi:RNA polymerase sigma-70 factor (ECF subfamily)